MFVGLFFIIPCMDNYIKVDLRTVSFDVPPQEVSCGQNHTNVPPKRLTCISENTAGPLSSGGKAIIRDGFMFGL